MSPSSSASSAVPSSTGPPPSQTSAPPASTSASTSAAANANPATTSLAAQPASTPAPTPSSSAATTAPSSAPQPKPAPSVAPLTGSPRLVTMSRDQSPRPISSTLDSAATQGRASPGLRNAALGSSLRAPSPASVSKAPWANVKSSPAPNPTGKARPGSILSDFPTAAEAAKAKQEQEEKAAAAAAREAARQQAALQNLDRFRGTSLGSGNHWDEMEDEDGGFLGEVVEFADGTQYKIPTANEDKRQDAAPVTKEDRFKDVSHDRSWPPRQDADRSRSNLTAWGPGRAARGDTPTPAQAPSNEQAPSQPSQQQQQQPRSSRQDHKPEKVIIPTGGASVSLRSPTESRTDYGYGYSSRERRTGPSYNQSYRQDAPPAAPSAGNQPPVQAVRAWGPLAQRQASLNPGQAPPPAPAAQTSSAVPPPATVNNQAAPAPHTETSAVSRPSQPPPGEPRQMPPAPSGRAPPPHIAGARPASHASRPLPPHLAQGGTPLPPAEEDHGRKTTFGSPPEPRKPYLPDQGAAPAATRLPWGPKAAVRQQTEDAAPSLAPPPMPAHPTASSANDEDEMHKAIERARKRRQQEEEARQAEKERARQKALAIEEKIKAAEKAKKEEEERRAAEKQRSEEDARRRQQAAATAQAQAQASAKAALSASKEGEKGRPLGPASLAANWRTPRDGGNRQPVQQSEPQHRDRQQQQQSQQPSQQQQQHTEPWRASGWRQSRPDAGQVEPNQSVGPAPVGPTRPTTGGVRGLPPHQVPAGFAAVAPTGESGPAPASAPQRPPRAAVSKGDEASSWRRARPSVTEEETAAVATPSPAAQTAPASPSTQPSQPSQLPTLPRAPRDRKTGPPAVSLQQPVEIPAPKVILSREAPSAPKATSAPSADTEATSRSEGKAQNKRQPASTPSSVAATSTTSGAEAKQQSQVETTAPKSSRKAREAAKAQRAEQSQQVETATAQPQEVPRPRVPKEPLTTKQEPPADRPPVWNRFVVSIKPPLTKGKASKLRKAQQKAQASRAASMAIPIKPVYPLTWEPALTHLSMKTLSRDDQFFPKKYQRGTVITPVSLPTKTLPRGLPPIIFPSRRVNGNGNRKQARFNLPGQDADSSASIAVTSGVSPIPSPLDPGLQDLGSSSASGQARGLASGAKIQVRLPGQVPANRGESLGVGSEPGQVRALAEPARIGSRHAFRAPVSTTMAQSSFGPLDHPRNGTDGSGYGDTNHGPSGSSSLRHKNRRNSNTPVAFYGDRQVHTPSPVSFMVNSEIKTDGSNAGGMTNSGTGGLSPFSLSGATRGSSSQTPASAGSVLPSPSLSTSGTWGQSSLTFPMMEPRSTNIADRDHIKSVWSLAAGTNEREVQNSLKDIGDDFLPSTIPLSVHDLRADDQPMATASGFGGGSSERTPRSRSSDPNFGHYSGYDSTGAEGQPVKRSSVSPVTPRTNGFDPTTRSPDVGMGSPGLIPSRPLAPHQSGGYGPSRSSAFMSMQNSGSGTSPTMQPFGPSAGYDYNQSAAAAAAAARNAFGGYGYGSNTTSGGRTGGSTNMPMYGGNVMGGGPRSRAPFGSGYASHTQSQAPSKSAPGSPYHGMGRSQSASQGDKSMGYTLFPTGGPSAGNQRGGPGGGAGVTGLGVIDATGGVGSGPIGSGRADAAAYGGGRHYGQQQHQQQHQHPHQHHQQRQHHEAPSHHHHQAQQQSGSPWSGSTGGGGAPQNSSGLRPAASVFSPSQSQQQQKASQERQSQQTQSQQQQQEQQQLSMYGGGGSGYGGMW